MNHTTQNATTQKRQIPTLQDMQQVYQNYTPEDQEVWQVLFSRQMQELPKQASKEFMEGLDVVEFKEAGIPNFEDVNAILRKINGWEVVAVEGIVDDKIFFGLLSDRKFPATTWLRKMSELDYLEEPDMFHDVFGHVPLLSNAAVTQFLQALSQIGYQHADNPVAIEFLSRIYWFTIEFGLIRENNELRIYGAGILSSVGETRFSLSNAPQHFAYSIDQILDTPYRKDTFQDRYFVIDSYEQLLGSIDEIKTKLEEKLAASPVL
ncbi:phenylalanine 4-monooxygenase [Pontibacter sp. E15-1]|uniref:phenylalanine 4-monooxygenase n=1 Tax=Pontibacter sp. E15-1 TaxID=2919918 RepID=UPI001F5029B5|nr:phenylalanine 4-monooxygenase [Pontibacter sp. E15-1]MCJ8167642.1 phenylalanine 4-monooxygenase [Pontibacter sp. E15-1]